LAHHGRPMHRRRQRRDKEYSWFIHDVIRTGRRGYRSVRTKESFPRHVVPIA
jgi:hypothetical protein